MTPHVIAGVLIVCCLVIAACSSPPDPAGLDAQTLMERGKNMYQNEKYAHAIRFFEAIVFNYPGESVIDTAQYYLALSYFGNEEYKVAEREFNRLVLNYPASPYFENAVFMRAVCYYEMSPDHWGLEQTDLQPAIRQFQDFITDYPESELVSDARAYLVKARTRLAHKDYEAGRVYKFINALEASTIYFKRVVDEYTDTEYAAKAQFQLGEVELKRKNLAQAQVHFENFIAVFPEHEWVPEAREKLQEVAFKRAEIAYERGELARARELFEEYQRDFPDTDKANEAAEYLERIGELPLEPTGGEQAVSENDG